jgi:hypothetical protein
LKLKNRLQAALSSQSFAVEGRECFGGKEWPNLADLSRASERHKKETATFLLNFCQPLLKGWDDFAPNSKAYLPSDRQIYLIFNTIHYILNTLQSLSPKICTIGEEVATRNTPAIASISTGIGSIWQIERNQKLPPGFPWLKQIQATGQVLIRPLTYLKHQHKYTTLLFRFKNRCSSQFMEVHYIVLLYTA